MGISGDAEVVLIDGAQRYPLPSSVPQGRYAIEATFPGRAPFEAGKITVLQGEPLTVVCLERLGLCNTL